MGKTQINIRVSETIGEYIEFLTEPYGSKTKVIEVAVSLLYVQWINKHSTDEIKKLLEN